MQENWRPVVGYEGLYEVSDLGRVRSLPRQTLTGVRGGRILKVQLARDGYRRVSLSQQNQIKKCKVCRLVLEAFVGPCPPGMESLHGPEGSQDDRLVSLRWGTRLQNVQDRLRDGTSNRGERHGLSKLTADVVRDIRARVGAGETQKTVARDYGISRANVCLIVKRIAWPHVD